jgi:hypothetical protein
VKVAPPLELIDTEGEGIYLLDDPGEYGLPEEYPGVLHRAARILECDWQEVEHRTVYMRPKKSSDEWKHVDVGRVPYGWKLNFPKRWRAVAYAYCTPTP